MSPDQYCEQKVQKSGSNLTAAFRILPEARRKAITALYAFCREVDDIADECSEVSLAAVKLAWWKTELDALYQRRPNHPVSKALSPHIGEMRLPREPFDEIIAGVQMDLTQNRYSDWQELDNYCDKVAGAVGLLSARIFGEACEETLSYALLLGRALQYTNIIRDVGDDARRNRIYLPVSLLLAHRVDTAAILRFENSRELRAALAEMAQKAHQLFDEALLMLPKSQRAAQRPGLIMAAIYRDLLRLLESESFDVMGQRISLAPARKLWLAWRTAAGMMPA